MPRRGNGEGTLARREDGRWQARLTLPDGKRKSYYGKTRKEAEQKLAEGRHSLHRGLPVLAERQNVGAFLDEWLENVQHTVRASTWRRYRDFVRLHIKPQVGKIALARLSPQQVQGLYTQALAKGLSPTTVHHLHTVLHTALSDALKKGLVARNVCDVTTPPRMQHPEMRVFTPDQAKQFLESVAGDRFEALYILALTTGMREGELLALRWQDVDMEKGALAVQASLRYWHGRFDFLPPKTPRSRRNIRLTPRALEAIRAHRARQLEARLLLGEAWDASNLVFCTHTGGPLEATNFLKQSFYPALKKAGLQRIRFHDLRHSCATLLLRQGVHPKIVSEMLGHAQVSITLDVYSHVVPDMQDMAVKAMEAALF